MGGSCPLGTTKQQAHAASGRIPAACEEKLRAWGSVTIAAGLTSNRRAVVNSKRLFLAGGLSLALAGCAGPATGLTPGTSGTAPGGAVAQIFSSHAAAG